MCSSISDFRCAALSVIQAKLSSDTQAQTKIVIHRFRAVSQLMLRDLCKPLYLQAFCCTTVLCATLYLRDSVIKCKKGGGGGGGQTLYLVTIYCPDKIPIHRIASCNGLLDLFLPLLVTAWALLPVLLGRRGGRTGDSQLYFLYSMKVTGLLLNGWNFMYHSSSEYSISGFLVTRHTRHNW